MEAKYDIFISYSNKDCQIVHKYAKFLEDYGYKSGMMLRVFMEE